jgi:DUF917 family protein
MAFDLDAQNLRALARGCAVLGTGAGGDPDLGVVMAQHAIAEYGPVPVVGLADLDERACVMPCGMVGAPTVASERIWSGDEGAVLAGIFEGLHGAPVTALMCFQIGGANGLLPVTWAARCGLPLSDADGMGRAFSGLHQQAMHVAGVPASPVALTDGRDNTLVLRAADDLWAARLASDAAASLGGVCAAALYGMPVARARDAVVEGTISLALRLGTALRAGGIESALAAVEQVLGAVVLIEGKVVDLGRYGDRDGEGDGDGDVVHGSATVQGTGSAAGRQLRLELQNEFLLALEDGEVRASVPDIICVFASDTGEPIASETLRYGQAVAIVAAPGPAVWRSPRGLATVGPRAFGYDVDLRPGGTGTAVRV